MLGFHKNFPETAHEIVNFKAFVPSKRLQQTLTQVLRTMNSRTLDLETIAGPSLHECTTSFEFGIADANDFNYLSSDEANRILEAIRKKPFGTMDFFCVIRYHRMQKGKKAPLRCDYYMLRFTFHEGSAEIRAFQEKGPRYITPEDIINFIVNTINETSQKRTLKALTLA